MFIRYLSTDGGSVTSLGVQYAKLPALNVFGTVKLVVWTSTKCSHPAANDASTINVTVFEPLLLITPGAANMWETNNRTALAASKALAAKELSPIYDNILANGPRHGWKQFQTR